LNIFNFSFYEIQSQCLPVSVYLFNDLPRLQIIYPDKNYRVSLNYEI